MENQKALARKSMTKILKYLPRVTSSVTFQNPSLYSPAKDKKSSEKSHKSNLGIGFSGPMLSIVPSDTRRKIKNDSKVTFLHEPTSPKVSCMGQVKCKHYQKLTSVVNLTNKQTNNFSRTMSYTPVRTYNKDVDREKVMKVDPVVVKGKRKSGIWSLFSRRKADETDAKSKTALTVPKGPCLSTMKRFSSGRDAFMRFDWTTQVAPLDCDGEEVMNKGIGDSLVRVGGVKLEPRKEINLWKRRTMAQPQPLQVHAGN